MATASASQQAQGPAVTPPADPNEEYLPGCNWTLFRSLPTFDIRNGDPSDVTSVFLKASIPTPYHWVPIDGLAPVDGVHAIDGFIKSHLAYLTVNRPAGMGDAQVRKAAICLGTARAVSTTFYRVSTTDLIPGETAPPLLTARKTAEGELVFRTLEAQATGTNEQIRAELELSDVEKAAICALVKCATGIIPMQGYSLMMTNHHYLSAGDTQSRKVYAVVERAYWRSNDVSEWFNTDTELIRDVLWHKACHPVSMNIKTNSAMDPSVSGKLNAAGAGACASRLPAVETELRAANSYITLLSTVNPMFEICKGEIKYGALVDVVEIVKAYPPGVANPTLGFELPGELKGVITNRTTALAYLSNMLKRNQDMVAYCYGFYVALSESNLMAGSAGGQSGDTLKSSFSLTKLKAQSFASYTSGYQAYGDYQAVRNAKRARGEFEAPVFEVL